MSDNEYDVGSPSRRRGVRFHDDMDADESLHELHQSIRDLQSGQMRLEDDIQRGLHRVDRFVRKLNKNTPEFGCNLHFCDAGFSTTAQKP